MKKLILNIIPFILIATTSSLAAQEATELINKVVEANGGKDALHKLKDVSYDYSFMVKDNNVEDISKERYIFNKEVSFAEYSKREMYAIPQMPGITYTQFFDGNKTVSEMDGKVIEEQQPAFFGHILRKTNYYWFTMMFKLADPGVNHKMLPSRDVDGMTYKIVEMTFGENIGESSDESTSYTSILKLIELTNFYTTQPDSVLRNQV